MGTTPKLSKRRSEIEIIIIYSY